MQLHSPVMVQSECCNKPHRDVSAFHNDTINTATRDCKEVIPNFRGVVRQFVEHVVVILFSVLSSPLHLSFHFCIFFFFSLVVFLYWFPAPYCLPSHSRLMFFSCFRLLSSPSHPLILSYSFFVIVFSHSESNGLNSLPSF